MSGPDIPALGRLEGAARDAGLAEALRRPPERTADKLLAAAASAASLAGLASGTLGTAIGLTGPPIIILFTARQLPRDVFRGTIAAYFIPLYKTAAETGHVDPVTGWVIAVGWPSTTADAGDGSTTAPATCRRRGP